MANLVNVNIPKYYLLQLAAHGNMGTGKVAAGMRVWAEKRCIEHNMGE